MDIIERNTHNTKEDNAMITIGVDFHKQTSSYHVLDEEGNVLAIRKMVNDPQMINQFIRSFDGKKQLAMEATRSWSLLYDCVNEQVDVFKLGHPLKMKLITHSERKNDKNDAKHIAEMTHRNYLPQAHVTNTTVREIRSLVRFRGFTVNKRRTIKNQIHALVDRNVWPCHKPKSFKNLFCKRGLLWLTDLTLSKRERYILDQQLSNYKDVEMQIKEVESVIAKEEVHLQGAQYLRSVPGFKTSAVNFYTVLVETSDITRFHKTKGYTYYAGLLPREYSSGDKYRTGRLVKGANMHLRTALIESTLAAIRVDSGLRAYYKNVKQRKGSGAAIVATARKLACAVYAVLKEQRMYRYENDINAPAVACHPSSASSKK